MKWTAEHLARLRDVEFAMERGGYVEGPVDVMIDNVLACMSAGTRIPDPTLFALPTREWGRGYSRAGVRATVDLIREWRTQEAQTDAAAATAAAEADSAEPRPVLPGRPTPLVWSRAQLDWVREKQFTLVRRGGYAVEEVDDLLDVVLVALAHGERLPDVARAKFSPSGMMRQGYDIREVDAFLDALLGLRPLG